MTPRRSSRVLFWLLLVVLLVPALLLTVLRLAQPPGGMWVRLVSFAPLATPLYAAGLALVSIGLLRGRRRVRWLPAVAAVGALLGLHLWWLAPLYLGAPPAATDDAEPLGVMTANMLRGQGDEAQLVAAAGAAGVDLLVVSEATPELLARLEKAGVGKELRYRGGGPGPSTQGTMVFSRHPLGEETRVGTEFDSWAMAVETPDGSVRLLAVHPFPPVRSEVWRRDHAVIREAAGDADLIVGDLNATPDHRPLQQLAADGFRSAAEVANAGWQPTWPADGRRGGLPLLVQIDHVLVSPRFTALSARAIRIDGTDHLAVIATVAPR